VVAGGLGDALLELLDAEPDVAAHGREPAGTEEHDDPDDHPDPFGPWPFSTPSRRDRGPRHHESTAARPRWLPARTVGRRGRRSPGRPAVGPPGPGGGPPPRAA